MNYTDPSDGELALMLKAAGEPPRPPCAPGQVLDRARRRRRRQQVLRVAMPALAIVVATVGTTSLLTDDPRRDAVIAAPADVSDCPAVPPATADSGQGRLTDAARAVEEYSRSSAAAAKSFTGVSLCTSTNTLTVYRVPSSDFDRRVEDIARRSGVLLELRDAPYSQRDLLDTSREIESRFDELDSRGAHFEYIGVRSAGYVELAVSGNVEAARAVVADLGDKVVVVEDRMMPLDGRGLRDSPNG